MNANDRAVKGPDGSYGTIDLTCWPSLDKKPEREVDLRLPDGQHLTIPAELLIEQKDGSYYLPLHATELEKLPHRPRPMAGTDGCWPCV